MDAHTIEEYRGWIIHIEYDTDNPDSPRDWDNLGTMCCWHRRSWLGDKPQEVQRYTPIEWIVNILNEYQNKINSFENIEDDEEKIWKMFEKYFVYLPIHAYEHGGITIRSGGFSDPWDSGQLGFIYVSKENALKEYNQKKWSKKLEEKVLRNLNSEIKTYDQYLQGDVHGYMIFRPEDEDCDDCIDSCWGYYGREYAMEEAKSMVDWHIENEAKQEKLLNSCMSL